MQSAYSVVTGGDGISSRRPEERMYRHRIQHYCVFQSGDSRWVVKVEPRNTIPATTVKQISEVGHPVLSFKVLAEANFISCLGAERTMVSERPLVYSANRESHRFVHQRDDDRPTSKRESEFSPSYAELPPREIFVTSNSQQESVQSGGKMDSTESKTKLDDTGKAKIFTFEGLTPVSTIDDTREEAVSEHRSNNDTDGREVVKSPTGTSALTNSETSIGSRRTNPQIDTSSCILVKSTSSVKDKVAAWERRATTGTATTIQNDLEGDDEVPFDEEPMTPRTVLKKLNDAKIQTDSQLKPEEELPTLCTKEQESPENSDNEKPGTTSSNKPSSVVDKDSSLLDQEDQAEQEEAEEREPEIVEAPSDEAHEVVLRKVVDGVCSNDFCQRLSSDEICKGVSKLLNLA